MKIIEAKAFRTITRIHCLFNNEQLSAKINPNLHTALTRLIMTYACLACEFGAGACLL
jgi:hypothetical protein